MKNNNAAPIHRHETRADDDDDDVPILPLLDEENENTDNDEDDETLLSPNLVRERSASFLADQQAIQDADADIPDADQLGENPSLRSLLGSSFFALELSFQFSRDVLLRSLIEQDKGLVSFIPSPLHLASACPLHGEDYQEIVERLLQSNLTDIDGLNHRSLTQHALDYFSRRKYGKFTRTNSVPHIYYQCDALFTSRASTPVNESRVSQFSDDGQTISKIVYFLTVLNQRSFFTREENFDQHLLRHLLHAHSSQIERAFKTPLKVPAFTKGTLLEHEEINELTHRVLLRYHIDQDENQFQIDVNYFFIDSYLDQLADTYTSLFHTPITLIIQNGRLPMLETFLKKLSVSPSNSWGTWAMYELEICVDQLFTRRGKVTWEMFSELCAAIATIPPDQSVIQQRIFVHAFATCMKYNAKAELEHLITNYAQIFYHSCQQFPTDIRHNILAYCVVSFTLEKGAEGFERSLLGSQSRDDARRFDLGVCLDRFEQFAFVHFTPVSSAEFVDRFSFDGCEQQFSASKSIEYGDCSVLLCRR